MKVAPIVIEDKDAGSQGQALDKSFVTRKGPTLETCSTGISAPKVMLKSHICIDNLLSW